MFDNKIFNDVMLKYKNNFVHDQWPKEKYKWEAIKCFQDNWDIDADDFTTMLTKSLSKTANLLTSNNHFPKVMIIRFAEAAQEEVRANFIDLFDESKDVYERIDNFKKKSISLVERFGKPNENHFQNENAISTYLWLRYPDKYYIYKYTEVKAVSENLNSNYKFKTGAYASNIRNFLSFYNEICAQLQQDDELKNMLDSQITETCYQDKELKTLTIDVCFYISRNYNKKKKEITDETWWPKDYSPLISVDEWEKLLKDKCVFNESSLEIMKRMLDYGGEATCTQLSNKYGEHNNFYNVGSSSLAKRVAKKSNCPIINDIDGKNLWWPVLYLGKNANYDNDGSFIWKLRDELFEALKRIDLSKIKLYSHQSMALHENSDTPSNSLSKSKIIYGKEQFLNEVYMTESMYGRLVAVLKRKKNIILQGAPGVGKTYAAKRLAYSIMGEEDDDRIEFVQFHQNYSYEDFVMGYKPVEDGFELKYGIFYQFCQKATNNPNKDYFFIIDEINRGNLSKIFGELLMLIESDYRDNKITLAYNGLSFSVPKRLHIIGMMNTADRSLAMIDYALRRRFSFFEMKPGFDSLGFIKYQESLENETFDTLIGSIKNLNREISLDKSLGEGFSIGHSYFCNASECTEEWMKDVVEFDIIPMLSEYWFDDNDKLQRWENILKGIFQ